MVRYYGWYSNKSRGMRLKQGVVRPGDELFETASEVEIIDVPVCRQAGMWIISFITEASVIRHILEHMNLWEEKLSRDPPDMGTFRI